MKMWSSGGRRVLQELLSQPAVRSFSLSPAQNTVVVERWWQVPLSKVGSPPRLHPRRHRIYKLVEDTTHAPKEKMELILTQTVPKVGGRGDTVFVKKAVGRNKLLAEGLAVYPSVENKQMFSEELRLLREGKPEERIQTRTGQLTVELLKRTKLKINKMPSDEFQLTKEVVCRQFQKKLLIVVPPHALSLPFESVKDVGDYWCEVTVNGMDVVRIPISLMPYEDPSASYQRQLKTQMQEQQEQQEQQAAADVSELAAAEEATVKAVSEAAVEEAAGAAVSEAALEEATVQAVSEAAVEKAAVEAAAVSEAIVKAVSEAAVEAASDAAVEAEAGKDSLSEAAASGVSAAKEESAASTQTSPDTTAPPSDSPKKD
ncbi:large ribosomal subunit protein bL9m isoform X1 [Sebastes fasciatus]|uniref:large ribosomal subunit protein bL9m isoform X1 n=1 Tax=Sebastes fasciatus TaxID=394691 RepID=UPI003D9DD96C